MTLELELASDIPTVPRPNPPYCCPKDPGKADAGVGEGLGIGEAGTPIAIPPLCCPATGKEEEEDEEAGADEEDSNGDDDAEEEK